MWRNPAVRAGGFRSLVCPVNSTLKSPFLCTVCWNLISSASLWPVIAVPKFYIRQRPVERMTCQFRHAWISACLRLWLLVQPKCLLVTDQYWSIIIQSSYCKIPIHPNHYVNVTSDNDRFRRRQKSVWPVTAEQFETVHSATFNIVAILTIEFYFVDHKEPYIIRYNNMLLIYDKKIRNMKG